MARLARVPVQTVIIETDTPYLSKGWSILKLPPRFPMRFTARLGRRFEVDRRVDDFIVDLQAYFVAELDGAELGDLWQRPPVLVDDAVDPGEPPADASTDDPLPASLAMTSVQHGAVRLQR